MIEKWQSKAAFPRADYNRYRSALQQYRRLLLLLFGVIISIIPQFIP